MVSLYTLRSTVATQLGRFRSAFSSIQPKSIVSGLSPLESLFRQDIYSQQHQVRHRSNRSRRGLYDGKDIRSGNNVSFSMRATKRKFKPNVFIKRVYSETLDDMIKFHLTASALRSIDKAGGLDNYLLNKDDITEGEGYRIKRAILKRQKNQAKLEMKKNQVESEST